MKYSAPALNGDKGQGGELGRHERSLSAITDIRMRPELYNPVNQYKFQQPLPLTGTRPTK
jgi:hypothetical protein